MRIHTSDIRGEQADLRWWERERLHTVNSSQLLISFGWGVREAEGYLPTPCVRTTQSPKREERCSSPARGSSLLNESPDN